MTIVALAAAEVTRSARYLNVLLGACIVAAPWVLNGATTASRWSGALAGVVLAAASIPLGHVRERYGTWDRLVR